MRKLEALRAFRIRFYVQLFICPIAAWLLLSASLVAALPSHSFSVQQRWHIHLAHKNQFPI